MPGSRDVSTYLSNPNEDKSLAQQARHTQNLKYNRTPRRHRFEFGLWLSSQRYARMRTAAVAVLRFEADGRPIWIADAHRGDGKRFVVRADEKLNAFLELEAAIRAFSTALGCSP